MAGRSAIWDESGAIVAQAAGDRRESRSSRKPPPNGWTGRLVEMGGTGDLADELLARSCVNIRPTNQPMKQPSLTSGRVADS